MSYLLGVPPNTPLPRDLKQALAELRTIGGIEKALNQFGYSLRPDGWEDANFSLVALQGSATPSPVTLPGGTIQYAGFLHTAVRDVDGSLEYPHGAKLKGELRVHFHGVPLDATAGNAVFKLTHTLSPPVGAEPAETTSAVTVAMPGAVANFVGGFVAIPIDLTMDQVGSQFNFKFYRDTADSADTYANTIAMKTLGFHYEPDALGKDYAG